MTLSPYDWHLYSYIPPAQSEHYRGSHNIRRSLRINWLTIATVVVFSLCLFGLVAGPVLLGGMVKP